MKNICQTIWIVAAIGAALSSAVMLEAPQAKAASIAINNADFSNPPGLQPGQLIDQTNPPNPNPVPGWTTYDPAGLIAGANAQNTTKIGVGNPLPIAYNVPITSDVALIYLPTSNIGKGTVGLSQTLANTLTANTNYTLKVDFGNLQSLTYMGFPVDYSGFPGYALQLLAGGNVIAQDNNSVVVPEGQFGTSVVSYTALANDPNLGKPLQIRMLDLNLTKGVEIDFKNVSLTATPIPESPATLGLLAVGTLGVVSVIKKKLVSSKLR